MYTKRLIIRIHVYKKIDNPNTCVHLFYYRYSFILIFCVFYSMQPQGPPPDYSQQTQPAQPPPGYGPPPLAGYGPPPPGGYGPPPPGGYESPPPGGMVIAVSKC
jgi:hypothetical protein